MGCCLKNEEIPVRYDIIQTLYLESTEKTNVNEENKNNKTKLLKSREHKLYQTLSSSLNNKEDIDTRNNNAKKSINYFKERLNTEKGNKGSMKNIFNKYMYLFEETEIKRKRKNKTPIKFKSYSKKISNKSSLI